MKYKKILLGTGSIIAITAPILAVVSCSLDSNDVVKPTGGWQYTVNHNLEGKLISILKWQYSGKYQTLTRSADEHISEARYYKETGHHAYNTPSYAKSNPGVAHNKNH